MKTKYWLIVQIMKYWVFFAAGMNIERYTIPDYEYGMNAAIWLGVGTFLAFVESDFVDKK